MGSHGSVNGTWLFGQNVGVGTTKYEVSLGRQAEDGHWDDRLQHGLSNDNGTRSFGGQARVGQSIDTLQVGHSDDKAQGGQNAESLRWSLSRHRTTSVFRLSDLLAKCWHSDLLVLVYRMTMSQYVVRVSMLQFVIPMTILGLSTEWLSSTLLTFWHGTFHSSGIYPIWLLAVTGSSSLHDWYFFFGYEIWVSYGYHFNFTLIVTML